VLDINKGFRNTLVSRTMLHVSTSNTALQNLQNLYITNDPNRELTLHEIRDVFTLPSLRSIRGYNVNFEGIRLSTHPGVKEIALECSLARCYRSIEVLLRAYKRLEILALQSGSPALTGDDGPIDDYSGIGDTLRQHSTKLLSLEVVLHDSDAGSEYHDTVDKTPLGSLLALTSLQRLRLSYDALYSREKVSNKRPVT